MQTPSLDNCLSVLGWSISTPIKDFTIRIPRMKVGLSPQYTGILLYPLALTSSTVFVSIKESKERENTSTISFVKFSTEAYLKSRAPVIILVWTNDKPISEVIYICKSCKALFECR